MGYKVFFFESILEKDIYFAGSHQRRAWELEQMFQKKYVTAILCARGGYGANYLLPHINLEIIRANPKMFVGYSDVTSLLTYFCDHADLVTYHGPMVAKDYAAANGLLPPLLADGFSISHESTIPQPCIGSAESVLYGGCLSMLAASLGTPYEIQTEGAILFLEDVAAKPFQIDRMMMQLKYAGKLANVRGIVFGEMVDCVQPGGQDYSLQEVLMRIVGDLDVPIGFGLRSGHVSSQPNLTLPIGMNVRLEVTDKHITITA